MSQKVLLLLDWEYEEGLGIKLHSPMLKDSLLLGCSSQEEGITILAPMAKISLLEAKTKIEPDPISTILESVVSIKGSLSEIAAIVRR